MERYHVTAHSRMNEFADLPDYPFGHLKREPRLEMLTLTSRPPDDSRIGRWREEMSREAILAYQEITGDLLQTLGYDLIAGSAAGTAPRSGLDSAQTTVCSPVEPTPTAPAATGALRPTVKRVSLTWVRMPFRPRAARHMIRKHGQWRYFEICQVELDCGVEGFGETMLFYNFGRVTADSVRRVLGRSAPEMMWDDSLGAGLQQALFDAVGRLHDVPIHRLLGDKCRDRAPLGWWAIDMPGEDWAAECRDAIQQGYTTLKAKPRPWFDLKQQCGILAESIPEDFKITLDFNACLLDCGRGLPYLLEIEKFPHTAIFEEPIPRDDLEGYRSLRDGIGTPIVLHSGKPPIHEAVENDICDGFVVSRGGATQVLEQARAVAEANKPFWLQQVGTGITAAFSLHLAAVSSHVKWPATTCHQLYEHSLIRPAIEVENGSAAVPDAPGLGFELDEEAIERFEIEPFVEDTWPELEQLIAIRWPSGGTSYYTRGQQYWDEFLEDRYAIFEDGVYLESIENDGSREWKELHQRAAQGGLHSDGRPL